VLEQAVAATAPGLQSPVQIEGLQSPKSNDLTLEIDLI